MANKNFWLEILTIMLVLGMTIVGCDNSDTHKHSYTTYWSSNATEHWHECSCGDKADTAIHTFISGICSICSYNNNPFVGNWVGSDASNSIVTMTITNNTWSISVSGIPFHSDSYTYSSGNSITFTPSQDDGDVVEFTSTVSGNTMTVTANVISGTIEDEAILIGTYNKT